MQESKRGRKKPNPLQEENEKLRQRVSRVEHRLQQAETLIEAQKKFPRSGGIPRASFHRFRQPKPSALSLSQRLKPERSLSEAERRKVADEFHSQRFRDLSPAEIYATLLDEDVYLCSIANPVPYPEG